MFGHQDDHNDANHDDFPTVENPAASDAVGAPADDAVAAPTEDNFIVADPAAVPADVTLPAPADDIVTTDAPAADLITIKQSALQQLTPLVGHLEQTPEEKFRTTMMMIQASDDQTLIKAAYEAAGQIGDEKARAQALLDVINEINYFTQQQS